MVEIKILGMVFRQINNDDIGKAQKIRLITCKCLALTNRYSELLCYVKAGIVLNLFLNFEQNCNSCCKKRCSSSHWRLILLRIIVPECSV